MSGLSPKARALFDRARDAGAPSPEREDALFASLSAAIAATPSGGPPSSPPHAPPAPPSATPPTAPPSVTPPPVGGASALAGAKLGVALAALAAVGVAGWLWFGAQGGVPMDATKRAAPSSPPAQIASAIIEPMAPDPTAPEPETVAPAVEEPPVPSPTSSAAPSIPEPARRPRPRSGGSDLSAELALLDAAQSARRGGDLGVALRTLREHARLFPSGILEREREVLRATVLCERGDVTRGRAVAARFESSAYGTALSRACGLGREETTSGSEIP